MSAPNSPGVDDGGRFALVVLVERGERVQQPGQARRAGLLLGGFVFQLGPQPRPAVVEVRAQELLLVPEVVEDGCARDIGPFGNMIEGRTVESLLSERGG